MSLHYCAKCNGLSSFVDAAQLAEHEAREHGCANCHELQSRLDECRESCARAVAARDVAVSD